MRNLMIWILGLACLLAGISAQAAIGVPPPNVTPFTRGLIGTNADSASFRAALGFLSTNNTSITNYVGNAASATNLNASELRSGTVPLARLSAITGNEIADGSISNAEIAALTISTNKVDSTFYSLITMPAVNVANYVNGVLTNNVSGTFIGPGNWLNSTNDVYIFDGTSTIGGPPSLSSNWPEYARSLPGFTNRYAYWTNVGVGGAGIAQAWVNWTNSSPLLLTNLTAGQNGYFFEGYGINDLISTDPMTLFSYKSNFWKTVTAAGFKLIAVTLPAADDGQAGGPYPRSLYWGQFDANRRILNNAIRTSSIPAAVLDFDAVIQNPSDTALYSDRVHYTTNTRIAMASYAQNLMTGLGKQFIREPPSRSYQEWRTDISPASATYLGGCNISASLLGGDSIRVWGVADALTATSGSYRSACWPIPTRQGWTNLDLTVWIVTPSSNTTVDTLIFQSSQLATNLLASSPFGGMEMKRTDAKFTNTYPNVAIVNATVTYTNDYSPRYLWIQFADASASPASLTNDIHILRINAVGR